MKRILTVLMTYAPMIHRLGVRGYMRLILGLKPIRVSVILEQIAPDVQTYVYIGANDGVVNDFVQDFALTNEWKGILVEPVPPTFERLRKKFGQNPFLKLENSAISAAAGELPIYVHKDYQNGVGDQVSSLDRNHLLKFYSAQDITEITVPVITFDQLKAKHHLKQVDMMVVDTEGHDVEILSSIDLSREAFKFIIFEHIHVLRDPKYRTLIRQLKKMDYHLCYDNWDTIAYKY